MYLHKPNLETEKATGCWLSSMILFSGGGEIYCYANFFYYAIIFGPNFRERQKFSGGGKLSQGLWKKARMRHKMQKVR